jgi:hypothetical protein
MFAVQACMASSEENRFIEFDDPDADRSFITGDPCEPPCWYGLEVDKSLRADVISKLESLPFIDHNSIVERGVAWLGDDYARSISFKCIYKLRSDCGFLILSDDVLKRLSFSVAITLSFEEIVNHFGEPEWIMSNPTIEGSCLLALTWPQRGISVNYDSPIGDMTECDEMKNGHSISPNLQVSQIHYMTKEAFTDCEPDDISCTGWIGFRSPLD